MNEIKYYWSFDKNEEIWRNSGDSIEGCIEEAKLYAKEEGKDHVYISKLEKYEPAIDGEHIIDYLIEQAFEEYGESSDGWLDEADATSLGEVLTDSLIEWLEVENKEPHFGDLYGIQCYSLKTGKYSI